MVKRCTLNNSPQISTDKIKKRECCDALSSYDNKQYFDTIMKYPLDEQQRRSVVILEDNCLVTENGCENLSAAIPRTIEEIEAAMAK